MHTFANDLERPIGTYLYGRRMYEVMQVWETMPTDDEPAVMGDYAALWKAADKVVYSTTIAEVSTPRTRLERVFDPEAVRSMKAAATADLSIGGRRAGRAGVARPGWSTSSTRSWCRWSSVAAPGGCLTGCIFRSRSSTSTASRTGSSTSTTAARRR